MDYLSDKVKGFFNVLFSYVIAVARLVVWTIIFFFTGLQRTLFMRSEVVCVEFKVAPLRCDLEDVDNKLSFVDKLYCENPDLACLVEEEADDDFDFLDDNDEFPPNDEGEEE